MTQNQDFSENIYFVFWALNCNKLVLDDVMCSFIIIYYYYYILLLLLYIIAIIMYYIYYIMENLYIRVQTFFMIESCSMMNTYKLFFWWF